ncbi:MAG: glycoside-pentoside-hexuronide (GPH):cation symporter [Oscillospiraceae bacterium]|nr:glycoside-pentoside-hexuronide (GPH):cation symporter [Oscillospiraceae bacterium]
MKELENKPLDKKNAPSAPTSGITMKDKIGYALGDMGGLFFFSTVSAYLQMFYTEILRIPLAKISNLLLAVRIWDGINDPICGTLIDRRKPSENGKFRPFLRMFSPLLAVFGVLMFTRIPGLSAAQYLIYAYITHILYEGMYTMCNIPYGSMASVITDDGAERSQLSTFRSIGAGLGGLPAQMILPMFVFSVDDNGQKFLNGDKFFMGMVIFGILTIIVYWSSFYLTKERIAPPPPEKAQKQNIGETISFLLKNKPFLVLCFASMLMVGTQFYTQNVYNYLYKDYFNEPELYTFVTIATYAPMVFLIPFIGKLVEKFGKKRLCGYGLLMSMVANIIALLIRTANPYVFLVFCFLSGLGFTFFLLQIWAMATDVIDYQELISHKREEGTSFAFFFFTRKIGQTLAGAGAPWLMMAIGYKVAEGDEIIVQAAGVADQLYTIANLVPAITFFLMFITVSFLYPLDKEQEEDMRAKLRKRRAG